MKRYRDMGEEKFGEELFEDKNGAWVRWSDVEKARQQLKKALCGYEPDCVKKVKQCLMCERIDKVLE